MMPESPEMLLQSTLHRGISVVIRPVLPEDVSLLQEGFSNLSDESRYLRFLSPKHELSERDLGFLRELDSQDHVAWGAFLQTSAGDRGIGIARYVHSNADPRSAEAAITVIDPFQHRGIGTLLVGALYWSARNNGLEVITGYVSATNQDMTRILRDLDGDFTEGGFGVRQVTIGVLGNLDELPLSITRETIKAVFQALSSPEAHATYSCDRIPVSINAGWVW